MRFVRSQQRTGSPRATHAGCRATMMGDSRASAGYGRSGLGFKRRSVVSAPVCEESDHVAYDPARRISPETPNSSSCQGRSWNGHVFTVDYPWHCSTHRRARDDIPAHTLPTSGPRRRGVHSALPTLPGEGGPGAAGGPPRPFHMHASGGFQQRKRLTGVGVRILARNSDWRGGRDAGVTRQGSLFRRLSWLPRRWGM